jgi:HlyD family secretion protein
MKIVSLALASFVGLGLWYVDPAIVRAGATWLRSELAKEKNTNPSLPQYVTAQVEEGAIRRVVTTTGTLNAVANVEVSSVLSGQIARVFVDFNDLVKKGQPLAQLDQRSLEARVEEAQATADLANDNINTAKVKLDHSRIKAQQSEAQIAVLKARLDDAQVNLDKAKTLYRRKQQLVSRQAASAMELEDATMSRSSAEAKLREAEATAMVQLHNVAGTKADVRRAESEYQSALNNLAEKKAILRLRQIDLDRSTIRSPLDGVVVGRNVNEGQTVVSEQYALPLFIVAGDLSQMQIAAKVDEADISTLGVGQQAVFRVDAYPGRQFSATVKQVRQAPEVEQNVVIYTVILSAANRDGLLLPGMTAIIDITVNQTGPILKVPLAALRFSPKLGRNDQVRQSEVKRGKPAVLWVVGKNGEPKSVSVGLGEEDGNDAAVLSGELAKGDLVIVGERTTAISWRPFGIRLGS